jgi:hypothetical protein
MQRMLKGDGRVDGSAKKVQHAHRLPGINH